MDDVVEKIRLMTNPSRVALIGASETSPPAVTLRDNIIELGPDVELLLVNPRRDTVFGEPCYDSVEAIDEAIDLAVIAVPAPYVVESFEECCRADVETALIISAGVKDLDGDAEAELRDLSDRHGVPFCGPNSLGIASITDGLGSMIAPLEAHSPGNVSMVSQSGGVLLQVMRAGAERGIDFSKIIDGGNQVSLSFSDYLEYLVDDDTTECIVGIIEAFPSPEKFLEVAEAAVDAGKPIIMLKIARGDLGMRTAQSHTGAIAESYDVVCGVFEQLNVVQVRSIADLIETVAMFSMGEGGYGNRVAFVDNSGGGSTLFSDVVSELSPLEIAELADETREELAEHVTSQGTTYNPIDLGVPWSLPGMEEDHPAIVAALESDPNVDTIVVRYNQTEEVDLEGNYIVDRFEELAELASDSDKGFVVLTRPTYAVHERWLDTTAASGIPTLQDYQLGMEAVSRAVAYAERREAFAGIEAVPRERRRLEAVNDTIGEFRAKELLAEFGIETVAEDLATSADEAVRIADEIGYPVGMKVLSGDVLHKTDIGGIELGLSSAVEVREGYSTLLERFDERAGDAVLDGILVQRLVPEGVELLVGAKATEFGMAVLVGMGGIFTEVYEDAAIRIAPIDESVAGTMLDSLAGRSLLEGARGSDSVDRADLVSLIARFSRFVAEHENLAEVDLNPVIAGPEGVVVVDALIRLD